MATPKPIIIHALTSRSPHIPAHALRSGIMHFVTCKVCRRTCYPAVTREVQIPRARRTRTRALPPVLTKGGAR